MATLMQAPREMVEEVASLRFPPRADRRLRNLMHRNTEGLLVRRATTLKRWSNCANRSP
jgi:hypothetical protein